MGCRVHALPHTIQLVVRGVPAATVPVLERVNAHGSPQAHDLAASATDAAVVAL